MPPRYVNNRGKLVPVSVYTVCKVYSATCQNITENESSEYKSATIEYDALSIINIITVII